MARGAGRHEDEEEVSPEGVWWRAKGEKGEKKIRMRNVSDNEPNGNRLYNCMRRNDIVNYQ